MKVVFRIPFLTLSKVKVDFVEKVFILKTYIIAKALSNTKRVYIIGPKKFAKAVFDPK